MRGDDDEHPANNRAEGMSEQSSPVWIQLDLQSNMIATAINIMST